LFDNTTTWPDLTPANPNARLPETYSFQRMICGRMGRQQIRIIFDAMGGDHAPQVPVEGAVMAARAYGCKITLVGPIAQIEAELARHDTTGLGLTIVDAPDVIEMEEHPAQAIRRKSK